MGHRVDMDDDVGVFRISEWGAGGGDDGAACTAGGGGVGYGTDLVGASDRRDALCRARALPPPGEYEERAQAILDALAELDVDVDAGLSWLGDDAVRVVADALRQALE